MIEDRIKNLRGELTERNKEIDILKGEASKQSIRSENQLLNYWIKKRGHLARE